MKEATGELNMTVITVVAIAAVAGFFYAFVWPAVQANIALSTACSGVDAHGNSAKVTNEDGSTIECKSNNCTYKNSSGRTTNKTCSTN